MHKIDFKNIKHPYFIGIGGIGMSAIARMFIHEGKTVAGSDLSHSMVTSELEKAGAHIRYGEPAPDWQLPANTDLIIFTIAIPKDHKEFVEAKKRGIPMLSYPEALGLLSQDKFTIAIAGSHGKTTTTAMIAKILVDAGLDPTVIVGSFLKDQQSNFVAGKSEYLVAEACEYKRSFLNLRPKIAVVLGIDDDHLDYYGNIAGVQQGFKEFIDLIKEGGVLVTDVNHPNVAPLLPQVGATVVDYQSVQESFKLKIPGHHNIENARAALTVAAILGVPKEKAIKALESFSGTWRRFDYRGQLKNGAESGAELGALVYDDYGHHPTEIGATLKGAREKFPDKKIIVAFQPHLYSRTKEHLHEFGPTLGLADEVLLLPIYAAREPHDPTVSSEMIANDMKKAGSDAKYFADFKSAADYLKKNLKKDDVFFTMGAGDINTLGDMLLS